MAIASAKTSRPQPLAAESGVRKKPSAERGPNASMAMRQPPSTITRGLRQSALAATDCCAGDGLDIGSASGGQDCEARHRLLRDRKIDQARKHTEQNRQPPDGVIGAGALERKAAEQHAEKTADLMAEE